MEYYIEIKKLVSLEIGSDHQREKKLKDLISFTMWQ